jgi:hypothetical protein
MKTKLFTPQLIFVSTAILIGAISRLFPHIDNFTPIAAMALFGGAYITDKRLAFIIPMLAMIVSDIGMELVYGWGFHNTIIYVYAAFVLTTIIGMYVGKNITIKSLFVGSATSSVLFFIITNFGYWAANNFQMGLGGLNTAYIAGIPFFRATMLGDLFYNTLFFGAFYLAKNKIPALIRIK